MSRSIPAVMLLLGLSAAPAAAQVPPDFLEEWLLQFDASAEKFIALAEAMPAESTRGHPAKG